MAEEERAVLIGGPLDGHETAPRVLPFIWVSPVGGSVRVYDKPGGRRVLYRRVSDVEFMYAGLTHAICEGCDQPQWRKEEVCSLCGAKLIPA